MKKTYHSPRARDGDQGNNGQRGEPGHSGARGTDGIDGTMRKCSIKSNGSTAYLITVL